MKRLTLPALVCAALLTGGLFAGGLAGCGMATAGNSGNGESSRTAEQDISNILEGMCEDGVLDVSDMFTERDLIQSPDLSDATSITVQDGQDVTIDQEGIYLLSGSASDVTVVVEADDAAKVQLVLDGLTISNSDEPAIYVASADKVFITTTEESANELSVSGTFGTTYGDNVDGVIFAKDDITLNGLGTLTIQSSANGIVGKDDVKVTGGTYQVTAGNHAIQGEDSVRIAAGDFSFTTGKDGIHAENGDDPSLGYVYICGGSLSIDAESDGIEGDAVVQVDAGDLSIAGEEGIEGTTVQINGGTIDINASDDGINATSKSSAYQVLVEINGGTITIQMAAGDTDALDSNGNLVINGGTIDISAQSPFDYDGAGELNGGTVTVNGQQVTQLSNQMMGGMGMMGGDPGAMGNMGGQGAMPDGGMPGGMPGGAMPER